MPVVAQAVDRLGADQLLVTTLDDDGVRAVRDWADAEGHDLLVGLSLGRGVRDIPVLHGLRIRLTELFPGARYRDAGANLVVAHHWLARLRVRRFARRHRLPLLVWTVDTPRSLAYWMRPGRAWLVTTNEPEVALAPAGLTEFGHDQRSLRRARPRRPGRALPGRDHRAAARRGGPGRRDPRRTPRGGSRPGGPCCTCTASATTSSRPSTPSGGTSAATTSTPSTCASTAARCGRTRRPTTSPTCASTSPSSTRRCTASSSATATTTSWSARTRPAA